MALTPAERKKAERARYKAAGLVAVTVWIKPKPELRERLYRYAELLNKRQAAGK